MRIGIGFVANGPTGKVDPSGLVESHTVLNMIFGGDHVMIHVERGSIHAHCTGPSGVTEKVHWLGTRFEPINASMFKRLMGNPNTRAILRESIAKARKLAQELGRRSGSCAGFAIVASFASVAAAGVEGGPDAAAQQAMSEPVSLAQGLAISGAAGAATHVGLAGAGVTVTSAGGAAVLGAGATLSVGGAVVAGGAITLTAAVAHSAGTGIASIKVGRNTIGENVGEGLYYIAPWAFTW